MDTRGGISPALQHTHTPVATNAMVIYFASAIPTVNSFSILNDDILAGLDNEDVQEDLLARAALERQSIIPLNQAPPSCTIHNLSNELGIDEATASDSEEESVENYTNDPKPLDSSSTKTAKKRGRPKKEEASKKPLLCPNRNITLDVLSPFWKPLLLLFQPPILTFLLMTHALPPRE